jgi:hypothetical protein
MERFSLEVLTMPRGQVLHNCLLCWGSEFTEGQTSLKMPQACSFVACNTHDSDVIGVGGTGARNHMFKGDCNML